MSVFTHGDSIIIVGGIGDKSGASSDNGGGCTKEFLDANGGEGGFDLSLVMSPNGGPLYWDDSGVAGYDNQTGNIALTSASGLSEDMVGLIVYVISQGGAQFVTGRYVIEAVNISTPSISIQSGLGELGQISDVAVYIGGAIDSLTTALNSVSAETHNVNVYSNLSETVINYTLSNGGSIANNAWLTVTAFKYNLDDMLPGGQYYQSAHDAFVNGIDTNKCQELNGGGASSNVLTFSSVDNVLIRGFYITNANGRGAYNDNNNASFNIYFMHCKYKNLNGHVYWYSSGTSPWIVDCYYDAVNNSEACVYFSDNRGVISNCMFNSESSFNVVLLCSGIMKNCLVIGGFHGINLTGSVSGDIVNCTLYGQTDCCLFINNAGACFRTFGTIMMPTEHDLPAVKILTVGGSFAGDYNCYWGADGNQLDNIFVNEKSEGSVSALGEHDNEIDPLFADTEAGQFRPKHPALIVGGSPAANINTYIGAVPPAYNFKSNARSTNLGRMSIVRG